MKGLKRFIFILGNFGSGKTEISINLALDGAEKGRTVLVDMDIINPYFKSSSKEELLTKKGVRVIKPDYANTTMDVPTLPAEIYSPFDDKPDRAVFDIGGDPVGSSVLGLLRDRIREVRDECDFLMVVNPFRPMQDTPDKIISLMEEIEVKTGIRFDGFISNGNIARETTIDDIYASEGIARELSEEKNIPVYFTAIEESLAKEYNGENKIFPVHINMRPEWLDNYNI